jgi:hypothetical protein
MTYCDFYLLVVASTASTAGRLREASVRVAFLSSKAQRAAKRHA